MKPKSSEMLWTVKKNLNGYFYELRCKGTIITIVPVLDSEIPDLKKLNIIKEECGEENETMQ